MSEKYSAREAFEMAMQMEKTGAEFYMKAAESEKDAGKREILVGLAEMERNHEKEFESLAGEFAAKAGDEWFDPDGQAAVYLRALSGGRVFGPAGDAASLIAGAKTQKEVLQRAIVLEKDSILFYIGIRKATPPELGRDRIDTIIEEEMKHVVLLDGMISKLKGGNRK